MTHPTRDEILAGTDADLNRWCAEFVMGEPEPTKPATEQQIRRCLDQDCAEWFVANGSWFYNITREQWEPFSPAADIRDAMGVVEKILCEHQIQMCDCTLDGHAAWRVELDGCEHDSTIEPTLPRAITIAALLAKIEERECSD